jgi:N-methylhydantoinase A
MQFSDIVAEMRSSQPARSRAFDGERINAALDAIDADLAPFAQALAEKGFDDRSILYTVDAHYAAQVWELDVPLPAPRFRSDADVEALVEAFHAAHERVFAVTDPDSEIEFVGWTGRLVVRLPHPVAKLEAASDSGPVPLRTRRAWFGLEESLETPVHLGAEIAAEQVLEGPALIEEPTTTIVLHPGMRARLSPLGNYVVDVGTQGSST